MSNPPVPAAVAATRIAEEGDATYLDVRTVAEFTSGRPRGRAVNIPIVFRHPTSGAAYPNEAFTLVAEHALDKHTPLIVGADADDDRASFAAAALADIGFIDVTILEHGIGAWREADLPVTGDNRDGVSYVSLLTPARRAHKKS